MEDWEERISIDNEVMGGKPVIKGTRVPVHVIVGALAAGDSMADVCSGFLVTAEDVLAALAYAANTVKTELVHALPRR